ncbi:hypothetical protein [Luteimonas salinilitoris]|uniref:Uncharacterized protein n=1 Tax=Luteimonas salinilitoris TaxID=3237697 RepID=A0ABV4HMC9_9GAMM
MTQDRDPLTPEERALAERLAQASPRAEPSPALDARILAAARATATETPSASVRPRRRRWPATLGIAASLALAVGIAWQLRPLPQQAPPPVSEAPLSVAPPPRPAESAAQAIMDAPATPADQRDASTQPPIATQQAAPERRELAPPSPPQSPPTPASAAAGRAGAEMETDAASAREAARQAAEATQAKEQTDMAARRAGERQRESAIVLDAPSPAPASPAPPPPPPSAAEPTFVPSPPPVETAIGRRRVQQRAATHAGADATPQQRDVGERTAVTGTRLPAAPPADPERDPFLDQPLDDEPPATADSPEVYKAWLARIRELHEEGEHEAARESLREFHRRHPDVELPEDLSGLLEE